MPISNAASPAFAGAVPCCPRPFDGLRTGFLRLRCDGCTCFGVRRLAAAFESGSKLPHSMKQLPTLLDKIINRILKLLTRLGHLIEEEGTTYMARTDSIDPDDVLMPLQAASSTYRIALGPRTGRKVLSLKYAPRRAAPATQALCANAHGFSLHSGVHCAANQRSDLEQLCRHPGNGSWTGWSVRLWGCRARRDDAEWLFHSKALQRRHAPPEPCDPPRSVPTIRVRSRMQQKLLCIENMATWRAVNCRFQGQNTRPAAVYDRPTSG